MKKCAIMGAFLALGLCLCDASRASIVNGSFEQPDILDGTFQSFGSDTGGIAGWTIEGAEVAIVDFTGVGGSDGDQFLDISGAGFNDLNNGISQNVSTVVGQEYRLSFDIGSLSVFSYSPSTIDLRIGGGSRTSFTNPDAPFDAMNWKSFEVMFTATQSSTTIAFYLGAERLIGANLDNIVLSTGAVPEPSSVVIMSLLTLCGAAYARQKILNTMHA